MAIGPAGARFRKIHGNAVVSGFPAQASLTTALAGLNNDLVYLTKNRGKTQNNVTVTYAVSGVSTTFLVSVVGTDITVRSATDAGGLATTTATATKAGIDGNAAASALVSVTNAGTDTGAGLIAALAKTNLAGGTDYVIGSRR